MKLYKYAGNHSSWFLPEDLFLGMRTNITSILSENLWIILITTGIKFVWMFDHEMIEWTEP